MPKDYYEILGISRDASDGEIKSAFRKLAHRYHPDKKAGNEEKFKEVNEAYQVLSDKRKRSQYDQFGSTFDQTGSGGAGQGFGGFQGFDFSGFQDQSRDFDFGNLGDIFGDVFGRKRQRGPARGDDIQMDLQIDFEDAVKATTKSLKIYRVMKCSACNGNGAEPGTKITSCSKCNGSGQITVSRQTVLGVFQQVTICPDCRGEGKIAKAPCKKCGGDGRVKDYDELRVKIPAGIDDGQMIKVHERGEAGSKGGESGDLYLNIHIKPHKKFKRRGYDIYSKVPINFAQAALGAEIQVETIDGLGYLKIPAGVQTGAELKIKDRGVPYLNGRKRGNHIANIIVVTPKRLSWKVKKIFKDLAELL